MNTSVIETVLFELNPGTSHEAFQTAAAQSSRFVQSCDGFIARRLSCTEAGQWIEHIEWRDIASAKAAAAKIGSHPDTQCFLKAIHGPSVKMFHSELRVGIND